MTHEERRPGRGQVQRRPEAVLLRGRPGRARPARLGRRALVPAELPPARAAGRHPASRRHVHPLRRRRSSSTSTWAPPREPGTFRSMVRGTVTTAWARLHHPRWYREVAGRGTSSADPEAPRSAAAFERRAGRAEALAGGRTAAAEPLRFAAGLYRAQGRLAAASRRLHAQRPLRGRLDDDVGPLRRRRRRHRCASPPRKGPPVLAAEARVREPDEPGPRPARGLLPSGTAIATAGRRLPLARRCCGPTSRCWPRSAIAPDRAAPRGILPVLRRRALDRRPAVGAGRRRRAARLLGCALCGGEWPARPHPLPVAAARRIPSSSRPSAATRTRRCGSRPARPAAAT